jgi:lipid II:glycine glycyltransferase (peptidoglycan interpeptide bridge formation enzyme)
VQLETITDRAAWNALLRPLPYAHVLQTWEWGEFKRATTGWQPLRLAFRSEGRLLALASVGAGGGGPLTVMYAPKGPAFATDDPADWALVVDALQRLARQRRAVWLKLDPDVVAATGVPGEADDAPHPAGTAFTQMLERRGWRFSDDQVQFRNTVKIDLTRSEDALLAAMSQNTRRKVRVAEREGVRVRVGTTDDLALLYDLYRVTGERDRFLIRPPAYYEQAWRVFMEAGLAQPLIAELGGEAIAHVILFHFGQTCWYFYGASSNAARDAMPNYLLQWEAMRWAKARGSRVYDLWGAPNTFSEADPMWGVYAFKRGFRGVVTRHVGAWDYAPFPPLYAAYTRLWPRVLAWMRGKSAYNKGDTTSEVE